MIFLLGGPPKVGKSIISGKILQIHSVSVVSTDSLGAVLENVWSPETAPDLFDIDKFNRLTMADRENLITRDYAKHVDYVIKESRVVWKAVLDFTGRENEEGRDVLIEGVGVLPELVNRFDDIPHRVVFIGNQGENHNRNIQRSAAENEYDWMRGRSDQYFSIFASFVNRMSAYIEQEAVKYGFEYIEMDERPFESIPELVAGSLGLKAD